MSWKRATSIPVNVHGTRERARGERGVVRTPEIQGEHQKKESSMDERGLELRWYPNTEEIGRRKGIAL